LRSLQIGGGGLQVATLLTELLLTLSRHSKHTFNLLPCLPGIQRVMAFKTLGVTITGKLSMSEHVRDVVCKCAQSLHIIRVLRCRSTNDQALQAVYRSVVIAKLLNRTRPVPDGALRRQTIVTASKPMSSGWASGTAAAQLVEDSDDVCSAEFGTPPTTFYMNCCRTQTCMTTNSGPGAITCH